jgi:putative tryptophan/tyrosine transport system substrate-binding protein
MRRREFIAGLGSAAAWPLAALAQQPKMPVIGFLGAESLDLDPHIRNIRQGLAETGYIEGRNLTIEYRWAEGHNERFTALAADLVRLRVAVIVTSASLPAAQAVKEATTTIPIVFSVGVNPVAFGLVASLNHPGGNLTGVTGMNDELVPKRLELLHELAPAATNIGLLINPTNPNAETQSKDVQAAARILGLPLHVLLATTERDFSASFEALVKLGLGALVISSDALFVSHSYQLGALSVRHAVPAIFQTPTFAAAGGIMSYGISPINWIGRQVGLYVGRILKGEKPAELPVQQPTKFALTINLKTAKALGLTVPQSVLLRADEVIE